MKKNIFTLLALLVCAVGSAWADDENIFNLEVSSSVSDTKVSASGTLNLSATHLSTLTGGSASLYNAGSSEEKMLGSDNSEKHIRLTKAGSYLHIELSNALAENDVITISGNSDAEFYLTTNTTAPTNTSIKTSSKSYTITSSSALKSSTSLYVWRVSSSNQFIKSLTITRPAATGPTITTQPVGGTYVYGSAIPSLQVAATASAGELHYQWYSCDDANKTNPVAINSATNPSYTPSATGFYYCLVSDSNGSTESNVVKVTIEAAAVPSFVEVTASATSVMKGTASSITAVVSGNPVPTIQWYRNTENQYNGGTTIAGATDLTLNLTNDVIGTFYYFAVAHNSEGDVNSEIKAITVNGSSACILNQVVFSNGFDAFITAPTSTNNGTVKAYYLDGASEPTITSTQQSDGATVSTATAGKIIVTAEDGTTTATYDITIEAVTPFEGSSRVFDGTETWVKTGNAYSTTSGKVGWVFSKNDTDWSRETPGKNRLYFFLAPSTSVTLANGGTARNIKVYRNGTELSTPTSSGSCTIAGDTENAYMVAVVSNQTSGDGSFKSMTVTGSQKESIAISCEGGYASYSCNRALDFTGSTAEAYIIKSTSENSATLTKVTKVPANTGIIVKGTKGESVNIAIATGATDDVTGNLLKATVNTPVAVEANAAYGLSKTDGKFHLLNAGTIPANKAYLLASEVFQASGAAVLDLDFEGETTGINSVHGSEFIVHGSEVYNLNGQRVVQPTKGLYIVNGRKVVIK